jgi:hypothetical protein
LSALRVDSDRLVAKLGSRFAIGMPVNCDKCLGECWGFDELPSDDQDTRSDVARNANSDTDGPHGQDAGDSAVTT